MSLFLVATSEALRDILVKNVFDTCYYPSIRAGFSVRDENKRLVLMGTAMGLLSPDCESTPLWYQDRQTQHWLMLWWGGLEEWQK